MLKSDDLKKKSTAKQSERHGIYLRRKKGEKNACRRRVCLFSSFHASIMFVSCFYVMWSETFVNDVTKTFRCESHENFFSIFRQISATMADLTQGSISNDSKHKNLLSIPSLIPFEQQSQLEENTTNGVHSTIRIDSTEQDGGFVSIQMLQHWGYSIRG